MIAIGFLITMIVFTSQINFQFSKLSFNLSSQQLSVWSVAAGVVKI